MRLCRRGDVTVCCCDSMRWDPLQSMLARDALVRSMFCSSKLAQRDVCAQVHALETELCLAVCRVGVDM
jgi:hypothetical protein